MEQRYPLHAKFEDSKNPAIRIYGNRIHNDQSIYEYLIEFLLVFVSAKNQNADGTWEGKMRFHTPEELNVPHYIVEIRNGFRRFIFYERAQKKRFIPADEEAYKTIQDILKKQIDTDRVQDKEMFLNAVRDLFYGYAAVLKKRSWCAQELLPLCPEMTLCKQMPEERAREKGVDYWLKKTRRG